MRAIYVYKSTYFVTYNKTLLEQKYMITSSDILIKLLINT